MRKNYYDIEENYIDKIGKQEDEECYKFLGMNDDDSKANIKKCYENILSNYLDEKLIELESKERELLKKNIKLIIENLNSSFSGLKHSLNINDFIKVKKERIDNTKNLFKSEIIKGFAMTKSACSKNMSERQEKAKILIFNFDLNEHEMKAPLEFSNSEKNKKKENKDDKKVEEINMNDKSWINKFISAVESLDVNVILINKGIDHKLMERLKQKIIVAINVKQLSLQKIAYCTRGTVIESLKDFSSYIYNKNDKNKKSNICGTCSFEIKNMKKFEENEDKIIFPYNKIEEYSEDYFKNTIYWPKYKLMKFESKNNDLFWTLLLSGTDKKKLVSIKSLLKEEIFLTAKEYYLQQKILYFLFCDIPKFLGNNFIKEIIEQRQNLMLTSKTKSSDIYINTIRKRLPNYRQKELLDKNENKNLENINNIKNIMNKDFIKIDNPNILKTKLSNDSINNKNINKQTKQSSNQNTTVINMSIIDSNKEEELSESPKFSSKKKLIILNKNEIFDSSKDLINKIKNDKNDDSANKFISPGINNENVIATPENRKSIITETSNEISGFSLFQNQEKNENENITINLNKYDVKADNMIENNENQKGNEANDEDCYKNGFDISPIIIKKEDKISKLCLIKLKMCKGDSNYNQPQTQTKFDKSKIGQTQRNIYNETEVKKRLTTICGKAEELELIYYNFENEEKEVKNKKSKDKQLGRFIIEMLADKDKKCPNEDCNNYMHKHFYYLYNSNCSRIKISYMSKKEFTERNGDEIINYINSKNNESKFLFENTEQNKEIDYNIDIFSYGYCEKCKQIVTPLIKIPKDFFAYSTAKFFKHILNNSKLKNRKNVLYNLINPQNEVKFEASKNKICEDHLSFRDISRIFISKYGILNIQYLNYKKYDIISIREIPEYIKIKNMENISNINDKKSRKAENNANTYDNKENKKIENTFNINDKENKINNNDNFENNFVDIIKLIGKKFIEEEEEIKSIYKKKFSLEVENNLLDKNIIYSINEFINLLNIITKFLGKKENEEKIYNKANENKNEVNDGERNSHPNISNRESSASKDITSIFEEIIKKIYSQNIDYSKKYGLYKKIAFRIAQIKVLYNKVRILIHNIKIYISLITIFNNIKLVKTIKESSKDISQLFQRKPEKSYSEPLKKLNEEVLDLSKISFNSKIFKSLINNYISLGRIQENEKDENEREEDEKKEYKNEIEEKNENNENNNEKNDSTENEKKEKLEYEKYIQMLDNIKFYEEKTNDYSSIIKESDLSSIVSYGISSTEYKTYFKERTNLLDIKRADIDYSNNNSEYSINFINECENNTSEKIMNYLYKTLLIFKSTTNYNLPSDKSQKSTKKNSTPIASIPNNNKLLETEILIKEKDKIHITIKSIDKEKFLPILKQSRKLTITRQTKSGALNSPNVFAKANENEYEESEKQLDIIDKKIKRFFQDLDKIINDMKNKFKEIKLNNNENNYEYFENMFENIKLEYNSNANQNNKENINNSDTGDLDKKKKLLNIFIESLKEQKKNLNTPFQQNPKKNDNGNNEDNKKEENDGNFDLIESIGQLYHFEDYIQKSEIEIVIHFPRQFEALRTAYCATYEEFLVSIMESEIWTNVSGGKSKASFYKTKDEKYLFKSINQSEFKMFNDLADEYFHHMGEYLFHTMPSLLIKTLGIYEIHIKKEKEGKLVEENYYLMLMENMNYGINLDSIITDSYDLKGSVINRYVSKDKRQKNPKIVKLDNNFREDFNNEPLPIKRSLYDLMIVAVQNDTLILSMIEIVDYSLLIRIIYDENEKINYIRIGIIDYIRKYTWDKKLEHYIKMVLNGFADPTIINPDHYKNRFEKEISNYFIGV